MKLRFHHKLAAVAAALFAAATFAQAAPKKLTVGHDLWIGYSGVFIAKEKGFFEKAGLQVDLKPFSNPGETLPALVGGNLDIGLATLQNLSLLNAQSDSELVAIYLIDSSNGADAVVAKSGITSIAGLKGKKVGATTGEVNHMLLLAALEKGGLSESDIQFTNMSADDAGAAFVAGKIDAAVTWEPWVTKAKSAGGTTLFSSADIPDTILDAVIVPKKTIEKRAGDWKAFLAAIDEGVKFLRANPEQGHKIIAKYLESTPAEVRGMLEGDKVYDLADNGRLLAKDGAGFASMKRVIDFATAQKLISKPLEPTAQFDTTFVAP
ncbi:MAG TPA: aliphatic sulfonate ABC transporter substrate-binding protein [Chthoniobacteraceae bacterium]|jgi:NitT/TauT family transport system substrate-binding protein